MLESLRHFSLSIDPLYIQLYQANSLTYLLAL